MLRNCKAAIYVKVVLIVSTFRVALCFAHALARIICRVSACIELGGLHMLYLYGDSSKGPSKTVIVLAPGIGPKFYLWCFLSLLTSVHR